MAVYVIDKTLCDAVQKASILVLPFLGTSAIAHKEVAPALSVSGYKLLQNEIDLRAFFLRVSTEGSERSVIISGHLIALAYRAKSLRCMEIGAIVDVLSDDRFSLNMFEKPLEWQG